MSFNIKKKLQTRKDRYDESQTTSKESLDSGMFSVSNKIKSEYDMWAFIFQEIANLRLEVSRLGTFVRINTKNSPYYLETYHSHIYSLLIPVSTIIPDNIWKIVDNKWLELKSQIIDFNRIRRSAPNKKIPFGLIRELDKLYRVALLAAQKAGLGIRITYESDIDKAIEDTITGS
jgi:hypothetical protein